jgi:hypothetical protein
MANRCQFRPRPYDASKGIQLGALVRLVDSDDKQQQLFIGPDVGSMKLVSGAQLVQVISSGTVSVQPYHLEFAADA